MTPAAEERFKEVQRAYDVLSDPRSGRRTTSSGRRTAGGRARRTSTSTSAILEPRRHLRRALRRRRRAAARRSSPAWPAGLRRRGRGPRLVRGLPQGPADDGAGRRSSSLVTPVTAPAPRPAPRPSAARTARAPGSSRAPGPLRSAAAVPGLPRQRHHRRDAVPDVPRQRPRAPDQALHGPIPAGVKDGTKIKLKGKGEAGWAEPPPATSTSSPGSRRRSSTSGAATTSVARRARHVLRGRDGRDRRDPDPGGPGLAEGSSGSQDGKLLRVKGYGSPKLNGSGRGDLLA